MRQTVEALPADRLAGNPAFAAAPQPDPLNGGVDLLYLV